MQGSKIGHHMSLYISRVQIKNIRCFVELDLSFDLGGDSDTLPWTMIVGDNATGKTALLKSIAIGLCDESSAAGLLRESEEGYLRRGQKKGEIIVDLKDRENPGEEYSITTTIQKFSVENPRPFERVRQVTKPDIESFPWEEIFVCAYGADRETMGTGDVAGYMVINTVYNMFNYAEGLQNPELTIHRIATKKNGRKKEVLEMLARLMLGHLGGKEEYRVHLGPSGIVVDGPWGKEMPLRDLADGYKATCTWLTDFLGWALSHQRDLKSLKEISGIVLIDEIEQHLHPKWQRTIVRSLRKEFPNVQFITTTHSPLVASSVGQLTADIDRDKLVHLALQDENVVEKHELGSLKGLDMDQVLASKAFDYIIDSDPDVESILKVASELAGKGERRSTEEEAQYQKLKTALKRALPPSGDTLIVRDIVRDVYQDMRKEVRELEQSLFGGEE